MGPRRSTPPKRIDQPATPADLRRATSAESRPNCAKTSSVCCPSAGGAWRSTGGVAWTELAALKRGLWLDGVVATVLLGTSIARANLRALPDAK